MIWLALLLTAVAPAETRKERKAIDRAAAELQEEASESWDSGQPTVAAGGMDGALFLVQYLSRYSGAFVSVAGTDRLVPIPQVTEASQLLAPIQAVGLTPGTAVPPFELPVIHGSEAEIWRSADWLQTGEIERRVVALAFFASWCGPCRTELPILQKLHTTYSPDGLGLVMISIDEGGPRITQQIVEEAGITFPVLHDADQSLARAFKAGKLPYLLLVGPDGTIKRTVVGSMPGYEEWLTSTLREML